MAGLSSDKVALTDERIKNTESQKSKATVTEKWFHHYLENAASQPMIEPSMKSDKAPFLLASCKHTKEICRTVYLADFGLLF